MEIKKDSINLIGWYKNGNYAVDIFSDGTKVRITKDNEFLPEFAENIDLKITNRCTGTNCRYCHEGSGSDGKHADILNLPFLNSLHPFQELAIGGGNVLEHPDLVTFLKRLKQRQIIANITVNQYHFMRKKELIDMLVQMKLIYGLGVSLTEPSEEFLKRIARYDNTVVHVINGIVTKSDLEKLSDHNISLLILGYKNIRRGSEYLCEFEENIRTNQSDLRLLLPSLKERFKGISFDNLAIEQLGVRALVTDEEWERLYMGEEGSSTFYIDAVEGLFGVSSITPLGERFPITKDVTEMFKKVRNNEKDKPNG